MSYWSFYQIRTGRESPKVEPVFMSRFLSNLRDITLKYPTNKIAFCFDSRRNLRKKSLSEYKGGREKNEERANLYKMINRLRKKWLPELGFNNVFIQKGYEADDIIASLTELVPGNTKGVIVSSDHDLYQLLRRNVVMYMPKDRKEYTVEDFKEEWGVDPAMWSTVKSLAGCDSDNIPGIDGVGEKTACDWVNNKIPKHHKNYQKILDNCGIVKKNMPLVNLPFEGTITPRLVRNKCTLRNWGKVCQELGLTEILSTPPTNFQKPRNK
jgi:DNA polymerase-1